MVISIWDKQDSAIKWDLVWKSHNAHWHSKTLRRAKHRKVSEKFCKKMLTFLYWELSIIFWPWDPLFHRAKASTSCQASVSWYRVQEDGSGPWISAAKKNGRGFWMNKETEMGNQRMHGSGSYRHFGVARLWSIKWRGRTKRHEGQ